MDEGEKLAYIKFKSDAAYLVCLAVIYGMLKNGDKRQGRNLYTKQWPAGLLAWQEGRGKAMKPGSLQANMSLVNELTENKLGCNQDFRWQEIVRLVLAVLIHQYWIGPHPNARPSAVRDNRIEVGRGMYA